VIESYRISEYFHEEEQTRVWREIIVVPEAPTKGHRVSGEIPGANSVAPDKPTVLAVFMHRG